MEEQDFILPDLRRDRGVRESAPPGDAQSAGRRATAELEMVAKIRSGSAGLTHPAKPDTGPMRAHDRPGGPADGADQLVVRRYRLRTQL